ncbi:MAG: hypothetical protein BJ554DRAFT_7630, partial [Olpidium bornovanus]
MLETPVSHSNNQFIRGLLFESSACFSCGPGNKYLSDSPPPPLVPLAVYRPAENGADYPAEIQGDLAGAGVGGRRRGEVRPEPGVRARPRLALDDLSGPVRRGGGPVCRGGGPVRRPVGGGRRRRVGSRLAGRRSAAPGRELGHQQDQRRRRQRRRRPKTGPRIGSRRGGAWGGGR